MSDQNLTNTHTHTHTHTHTQLVAQGSIGKEETTVLIMTGTGIKSTPRIAELLGLDLT